MPSTQTRTKLKKFQFIEGAPNAEHIREREAEKENAPLDLDNGRPLDIPSVGESMHSDSKTSKPADIVTCPPPSTPAARLPLADLVGSVDDARKHALQPISSPEEQLCWHGSQAVNTPLLRKRKRAQSSSPVSISQEEAKAPDSIRREYTTPQADPAMDLWNRYTNSKDTPSGHKAVAFAHLISESSPRSSANTGSISGLRRWASCGVEFPASTRKKRRTAGTFKANEDSANSVFNQPSSDSVYQGYPPEKSKLVGILEKMRDSIKPHPKPGSQLPSSSSPLPDQEQGLLDIESPSVNAYLQGNLEDEAVTRQHEDNKSAQETYRDEIAPQETRRDEFAAQEDNETDFALGEDLQDDDMARVQTQSQASNRVVDNMTEERVPSGSDDFGDVDFDTDMIDTMDTSEEKAEVVMADLVRLVRQVDSDHSATSRPEEKQQVPEQAVDTFDEFGLEEDDFAADLEHVASLYDTREEEGLSPAVRVSEIGDSINYIEEGVITETAIPVIDLVVDDDDFGDDIDADEFAAAEVAATQAPATTVRR